MAGPTVTVEGVEEANRAYLAIADEARRMTEPHTRMAQAGEDAARSRAPFRTGQLASSIVGQATDREATLTVGAPYWPYLEFGTRYVQAQRFAKAGIDAMARTAPDAYTERMAAIIAKYTA